MRGADACSGGSGSGGGGAGGLAPHPHRRSGATNRAPGKATQCCKSACCQQASPEVESIRALSEFCRSSHRRRLFPSCACAVASGPTPSPPASWCTASRSRLAFSSLTSSTFWGCSYTCDG